MEQFIIDQIRLGLAQLPKNVVKSFAVPQCSPEVIAVRKKVGGFIRGVCHPNESYKQISDANIEWIRIDIPFPYNEDGSISQSYLGFKERARGYRQHGIKVMAVTPYPKSYIAHGIDLNSQEDKVKEIAVFIINDLRSLINAVQITNEMGVPHFTIPLTMDEAARFIGIQAQAMSEVKGDILIGYNSAGPQPDLHLKLKPYHKFCDYVGIDIYIGCFANVPGFLWFFDAMLRYLWSLTGKPIILQEFGYISSGKAKSKEEKLEILHRYGAESIEHAYADIESFVAKMPERMQAHIKHVSPEVTHQADLIFKSDFTNHVFCELPRITMIPGCTHTPEGQARFFEQLIPRLYAYPFVCGAIIYCYSDSDTCYICSQHDCPTETAWGLVTCNGEPKPSYYAVQKAFGEIKKERYCPKRCVK